MSDIRKPAQADPLATQIITQLEALPKPDRIKFRADLQGPINELNRMLEQLDALPADRRNDDLRDRVDETRRRFTGKSDRLKILDDARSKVENGLDDARRLHDSDLPLDDVIRPYEGAVAHIRGLRKSDQSWDDADIIELSVLEGTAESARQRYLNDHQIPTTRQEGEGLVGQILSFAEQIRKDPAYIVTYFSEPLVGAPNEKMEVRRAFEIARTLLYNWWMGKIAEYLDNAQAKLDIDHLPREARGEMQRIDQLPGLDNPEINLQLPQNALDDIAAMRARVSEGERALNTAEDALRRAAGILESNVRDALEADDHYRLALDAFPFAPGLEDIRGRIIELAQLEIAPLLDTADTQLRREAWLPASLAIERSGRLLALQPATALPESRARHDILRTVYEAVKPLTTRPRTLSTSEERELLQQLAATYADDYWPGWASLARDLTRLQTLRNLQSLDDNIDAACKPSSTVAELEYLAEALADLKNNPPADVPKEKLSQLPARIRRVESWLGFARARDELAKAPKTGVDTSAMPDELELDVVADLQVAAEGLRMAGMDPLAKAAANSGNPNLTVQLERLKGNDSRADRILTEAESLLNRSGRASAADLNQKLEELKRELGRPNSHRQSLLVAYHEVRRRLMVLYQADLQKLLDDDRPNYYVNLSDEDLGRRLIQLKQVATEGELTDDRLTKAVEMARSMARAHRIEVQATRGVFSWEEAQGAWKTAREKAEIDSEPYNYALHRERQAYKQSVYKKSAIARDETTATLLQHLTEDEVLRDEWDVWYRHGSYLFDLIQRAIAPNRTYEDNVEKLPTAQEWIETARRSLRVANSLSEGRQLTQPNEIDWHNNLPRLREAVEEWDALLRAFDHYQRTLDDNNPQPADFLGMIRVHDETDGQLKRPADKGPDAKRWHNGLWDQVRGVAQGRLEARLKNMPANDILGQLNVLLCLVILSPEDNALRDELSAQSAQILHALQTLVDETVSDYGGAQFARRFLARNKRSPDPRDHLKGQLEEARETFGSLEGFRQTLPRIGPTQFPISETLLATMNGNLGTWITELVTFRNALDNALSVSQDGLRDPNQFDKANRILRVTQNTHLDEIQVPAGFINANHPTYRWAVADIDEAVDRRKRQEALRDKINDLIRAEREGVALALRARGGEELAKDEWTRVEGLRETLNQLRDTLAEMRAGEKEDATQLQNGLRYPLPEDPEEEYYSGAAQIEQIVLEKLGQYQVVAAWLAEWADPKDKLLKVVNWPKEKKKIAARRNRGPGDVGLNGALRQCRETLNGNADTGKSGDHWALRPAHAALSAASMTQVTNNSDTTGAENRIWFGLVEPLNRRRAGLQATLADHIDDNERMESDIIWRNINFQSRFDTLVDKKDALMAAHKMPWKVWEQIPAYLEFRTAVEEFCKICPDYDAFTAALEDARRHTGINFYCPPEEN